MAKVSMKDTPNRREPDGRDRCTCSPRPPPVEPLAYPHHRCARYVVATGWPGGDTGRLALRRSGKQERALPHRSAGHLRCHLLSCRSGYGRHSFRLPHRPAGPQEALSRHPGYVFTRDHRQCILLEFSELCHFPLFDGLRDWRRILRDQLGCGRAYSRQGARHRRPGREWDLLGRRDYGLTRGDVPAPWPRSIRRHQLALCIRGRRQPRRGGAGPPPLRSGKSTLADASRL